MDKYIKELLPISYFLMFGLSLIAFLYARRKPESQKWHKFLWASMMLFTLPAVIAYLQSRILPNPEYVPIFDAFYIFCIVCAFSLLIKGNKILKEADRGESDMPKQKDISKGVGLVFGIITLAFVPISFLFAIAAIIGPAIAATSQMEWPSTIAGVIFGVISVFLAVVGGRLINVRNGWKGNLFAPFTLWLRISGWLFILIGLIKLIQKNLTGLWAIALAIALLALSGKKDNKIAKTN